MRYQIIEPKIYNNDYCNQIRFLCKMKMQTCGQGKADMIPFVIFSLYKMINERILSSKKKGQWKRFEKIITICLQHALQILKSWKKIPKTRKFAGDCVKFNCPHSSVFIKSRLKKNHEIET